MDGDGLLLHHLALGGDEEYIVLLQRYVGHSAVHDARHVDRHHFQGAVFLHAMNDATGGEGFFLQSFGVLYQGAHAVDVVAQLVQAWTEYGSFYFYRIIITLNNRVDRYRVTVGNVEGVHVEFGNIEYRKFATRLANQAYCLFIGVAREASCVFQQRTHTLIALHFIVHGAFHLSRDVHQTVVGSHVDYVTIRQTHVARHLAVKNIVVNVGLRDEAVVAINLDVAQCSQVVGSSSHVQSMENRSEG